MALYTVETQVFERELRLKFSGSLNTTVLTADKFTLVSSAETSVVPIDPINLKLDYSSIHRLLRLRLGRYLQSESPYTLTIVGLETPSGEAIDPITVNFTTSVVTPPHIEGDTTNVVDEVDVIEDRTVNSNAFVSVDTVEMANPDFYVVDSDPNDGEYFVESDLNNGRVTVKFSAAVSLDYIDTDYFRVQRKRFQRAPSRWEPVEVQISRHSNKKWVQLDFPALETDPVSYYTGGYDYFEPNYKYRIIVSKDIGAAVE